MTEYFLTGTYSEPILFGTGELFKGKGEGIYLCALEDGDIRILDCLKLGNPSFLAINEEKKHLFIEKCDRDMEAFSIKYTQAHDGKKVKEQACYIHARNFLEYMARVIGVPEDSPSLRFSGKLMPDGTVFVDLNHYEVIEPKTP